MVTELALLTVKRDLSKEFLQSFKEAEKIIESSSGYIKHELQKCVEHENKFILLVKWETLENHTEGFRKSENYKKWKALLHHYYEPFTEVEHYIQTN
ncbi:antibiotic biosynthesis monooxygenase family protein [Arachidicoccus sp.]|uniref:antibiotic biosynthesis monooxygenase family protein n=1 Tax=Arachidicoccus sp. TaxID=1872624 RepID=UPI003D229880